MALFICDILRANYSDNIEDCMGAPKGNQFWKARARGNQHVSN